MNFKCKWHGTNTSPKNFLSRLLTVAVLILAFFVFGLELAQAELTPGTGVLVRYSNGYQFETVLSVPLFGNIKTDMNDSVKFEWVNLPLANSPLVGQRIMVRRKFLEVETVRFEFPNGLLVTNKSRTPIEKSNYSLEIKDSKLRGQFVIVHSKNGFSEEQVTRHFADGSVETNMRTGVELGHYATQVLNTQFINKTVMVDHGGLSLPETVARVYEGGIIRTNNRYIVEAGSYSFEIPDHPLVGENIRVTLPKDQTRPDRIIKVFENGSVQTLLSFHVPAGGFNIRASTSEALKKSVNPASQTKACERILNLRTKIDIEI
jgi:hypothetical protein